MVPDSVETFTLQIPEQKVYNISCSQGGGGGGGGTPI